MEIQMPTQNPKDSKDTRKKLVASMAHVLKAVHSTLLQSLKKTADSKAGHELTPVEWFNRLSKESEYSWLRGLLSLISDIDALLDNRSEISVADFAAVREATGQLFEDDSSDFKNRLFDVLSVDRDLIVPHSTLMRVLDAWPKTSVPSDLAETRRQWHIGERRLEHMRLSETKAHESKPKTRN